MTFRPGDTVGDYKIIGVLGGGGMGRVFKVEHIITQRLEAMKILLRDQANQQELVRRFLREVRVQASLNHPNIASVHNAFVLEDELLMVMEFIEGESLERLIQRGPIPWRTAVGYACQALKALGYAHAKAITHRDIKPSNIMITPEDTVKITDFGLAKITGEDVRLTQSGALMGSVYYAPPEQVRGSSAMDGRCDVYSLGVVVYEMVTGCKPFDGDSHFAIMYRHVAEAPTPPIERCPDLPQSLNDVILTAMAKTPEERLASAGDFLQALERVSSAPDLKSSRARLMLPGKIAGSIGAVALAAILVGHSGPGPSMRPPHAAPTSRKPPGGMLTLPTGTAMTVLISTSVSTSTHGRGQAFFATLKDPLIVGSETIATTGALIEGRIEEAEQGGRFKGRAQLVVRLMRLHTDRGIIAITSDSMSRQGGNGFLKRGSPAVLRAGTRLSFHTISPAIVTAVSNGGHN
jgi:serine/threonine-protein kinase